jgi:hypothetical protein
MAAAATMILSGALSKDWRATPLRNYKTASGLGSAGRPDDVIRKRAPLPRHSAPELNPPDRFLIFQLTGWNGAACVTRTRDLRITNEFSA